MINVDSLSQCRLITGGGENFYPFGHEVNDKTLGNKCEKRLRFKKKIPVFKNKFNKLYVSYVFKMSSICISALIVLIKSRGSLCNFKPNIYGQLYVYVNELTESAQYRG